MPIKSLFSAVCLAVLASPVAVFSASVSYVQPQIQFGSSIIGVQTDSAGNIYSLVSIPGGGYVVVKTSGDSGQSGWSAPVPEPGSYTPAFAVGNDGSVYITGTAGEPIATTAGALQPSPPLDDLGNVPYLLKLSPTGAIVLATYLCGEASCYPQAIAVDSANDIYITGYLSAPPGTFSPTAGSIGILDGNVFTLKVDPGGSNLLFAIGAGGTVITLDPAGDPYFAFEDVDIIPQILDVTSEPTSLQHVVSVDPTGSSLRFDAFLEDGVPGGIALDSSGNVYLAGTTYGPGYPAAGSPIQTVYEVLPSNPQNVVYSYCLPNMIDPTFPPNCLGPLGPPPLPSVPAPSNFAGGAGYASVIDPAADSLRQSTYFGGTGSSVISSISVNQANGQVNLTGYMTSSDLPGLDAGSRHCVPSLYISQITWSANAALVQTTPILPINGFTLLSSATGQDGRIYVTDGASVAVVDPSLPSPPIACIVNAADLNWTSTIAPGQLLTIFGSNLSNATVAGVPANGQWPTALPGANVAVTFDGIPAPLLYVSPNQINVQAPFEINGKNQTTLHLTAGAVADSRVLQVVPSVPTIFQTPIAPGDCPNIFAGATEVLAFNQDGSNNSCSHQATSGSTVIFFVNGLGATSLTKTTGAVNSGAIPEPDEIVTLPPAGNYTSPIVSFGPVTSLKNSISGVYSVEVTIDPSFHYDIVTPLLFGSIPAVNGLDIRSCGQPSCSPAAK